MYVKAGLHIYNEYERIMFLAEFWYLTAVYSTASQRTTSTLNKTTKLMV